MQQPFTNSEAVKRCLTIPDHPIPGVPSYAPKPPFGTSKNVRSRPYSAPSRRVTAGNYGEPWRSPTYKQPHIPIPQHYMTRLAENAAPNAPYAERRNYSYMNSTLFNNTPSDSRCTIPLPSYDPMNDPHLLDYFERRFVSVQRTASRNMWNRPSSASPSLRTRRIKGQDDGGDKSVLYKVAVTTGDKKGCGTDSKVFITLKGTKGKVKKHRLTKKAGSVKSNKDVAYRFAKGSTHIFKVRGPEIGDLKSINIETNAKTKEEAWFLQELEIEHVKKKKRWVFIVNKWFSLFHSDQQLSRELYPMISSNTTYEILVVTGDKAGAGTNANCFITIYGKSGITQKISLKKGGKSEFKQNSSTIFKVKSNCVGPMRKIRLEHDNIGIMPGWYVERVVVTDVKNPHWRYFFPCGLWLSRTEGDGKISRDLVGSKDEFALRKDYKYNVTLFTGDKPGAGTDANVCVTLFGEMGDSGENFLKKAFKRNSKNEFVLKTPCLGRIERLRIGHDNTGFKAGWYLEKVIVDDCQNNIVYEFPCNRWFATDEDDGQISRDLLVGKGATTSAPGIPYRITVSTGDERNAGTDARVFIILHAGKESKEKNSGKIWLDGGSFERNKTDIFDIDVATLLSPLTKIEIGHDNKGVAAGWFVDRIIVLCYATGLEQVFLCNKWLATDQEDGLIQRTLFEQKAVRKQREKKMPWNIWIYTSDMKMAGTDANVYVCVYGEKGKSDEMLLENKTDNFEQGKVDYFKRNVIDIGKPYKIRVWHDKSGMFSGWHLDKVEMEEMLTKERYNYNCGRWLADDEDDHEVVRECPATGPNIDKPLPLVFYMVEIYTGSVKYAGTDANVFINIFGELGDTGQRWLHNPVSTNINKFEKGQPSEKVGACFETSSKDVFKVEAVTLMGLKKIVIGHDAKNPGSGWFLDKVIVKQDGNSKYDTTFTCERWLDADEDDGQIVREITATGVQLLSTTTYNVYVKTGDESGAGTDANVHIKIFGSKNDTGELKLRTTENTSNKFEKGRTDHFKLEASDIGKIKKIRIGHDDSKPFASWLLDEVRIDIPSRGEQYVFACHRWLGKDSEDNLSEIEIEPSFKEDREKRIPYEVTIWTTDKRGAGTDANVFLQLYGVDGKTEKTQLRNRSDNFERGQKDIFKIEALDVGQISKIRIGHDAKKLASGWHLNKVLIRRRPRAGTKKRQKKKGPTEQERRKEILAEVHDDSDSDSSSSSTPRRRRSTSRKSRKPNLKKIEEEDVVDVYDGEETEDYWFFVDRWFDSSEDDKAIERELLPSDEQGKALHGLEEVEYTVKVYTGKTSGAGTDANVFINLYGEKHDSGERPLKDSADNMNKFETGKLDTFNLKAIDLGKLVKLKVRHDNKGIGAAWYLDKIEVVDNRRKKTYYFLCQKWLAVGKDDGQISRELIPVDKSVLEKSVGKKDGARQDVALEIKAAMTTYYTKVVTGTVSGAGTDANVYMVLYGDQDHTDKMFLKSSMTYKNKFESGHTDEFILEAVNIGKLQKIKIGHDNSGLLGAAWFLDKVIIDAPSLGCSWTFPCSKWLADNKDDCQLERELFPQELETVEYNPCVPYEIKTYTADERGAGTSANVYICLYGKEVITEEKPLCSKRERDGKFKRGKMDLFTVEMEDVGDSIEKLRIWHDNEGMTAGWKLDKIEVRKLHDSNKLDAKFQRKPSVDGSDTYVFQCGRWLARDEDDYSTSRELIPDQKLQEIMTSSGQSKVKEVKLRDKLKKKNYEVSVFTGDESSAGTDANVFLNIVGENGDAGERKLVKSETHMDKFERNHCDVFKIEAVDLGKLYKVKVRHDNSSFFKSAWYLGKIEIKDPANNEVYVFYCERWLAKNKDDGKIERSLYVKGYTGEMGSSTGSINTMKYGSSLSLDSMKSSKSPRMSRKQMSMASSIVGIPEGEQPVSYKISVSTGDGDDNGTVSNVYVDICGPKNKHTGKLFLDKEKFEPGCTDSITVDALDVEDVRKIKVGHDGTAPGTGWFVKSVVIDIPSKGKHYLFNCGTWLARDKSDGKTERTFTLDDGVSTVTSYKPMIPYECTVITGDREKAGTDMQITLTLFGTSGTSSPIILDKTGNRFERGSEDLIKLDIEDVGPLKKLRVETSGKGSRASWYLEKIALFNMKTGEKTNFIHDDWLSKEKGYSKDLPAKIKGKEALDKTSYKISVKTSNVRGAGTDANVYVILFGANGDTGQLHLDKSETFKDPFENDQVDVFTFKDMLSVGEMSKCRVWHDNKGLGAAWHLANIEVEDLKTKKVYKFHCDKWLSTKEDDKQIVRELTCGTSSTPRSPGNKEVINYELEVETSGVDEAGTMHHGWIVIDGEKGTKKYKMHNSKVDKKLRRGTTNTFTFTCKPLGKLRSVTVGACEREDIPVGNANGKEAQWLCKNLSITDTISGDKYVFSVNAWLPISEEAYDLADGKKVKVKAVEKGHIAVVRNLAAIKYEVIVYTGDVSGAGTNANVFITLFGEHGDSGKRPLKQSFRNLFEKNQVDKFTLECLDLGELIKVRVEHDNSGFRPGWFLEKVEVVNQGTSATSEFQCHRWFDKDKDDGQIVRDILVAS
ncbi:lipoxygenase homology domain-containing protein 1-like isoform X1 [Mytilus trossulus]|uniref:lipoxygenase homology domain-containing protein 1-like isoform X1 n=1 Tax=Mytilus trossulus TaxID=6551 RepID=UPI003004A928